MLVKETMRWSQLVTEGVRGSEGENKWEEDVKVTCYWQRENK